MPKKNIFLGLLCLVLSLFFACERSQKQQHDSSTHATSTSHQHEAHSQAISTSEETPMAHSTVMIQDAWVRAVPTTAKNTAAYLTLHNPTENDEILMAVQAPIAKVVELHQTTQEGELVSMAPVPEILIPAKTTVVLQPAGLHLMLIGLQKELSIGEPIPLTLTFAHSATQTISVTVQQQATDHHHDTLHHKHHE